jgi:hypothetical protein
VQDVFGSCPVKEILFAGFSRLLSRGSGSREGRSRLIFLGRAELGGECGSTGLRSVGVGGLHGLEEVGGDLAPADEQERSDRVERGAPVVAGDQRFGDVQG